MVREPPGRPPRSGHETRALFAGEAEAAGGDDGALDLAGAALDRVGDGAEVAVLVRVDGGAGLRGLAGHGEGLEADEADLLLELGAEELRHLRLAGGGDAGL